MNAHATAAAIRAPGPGRIPGFSDAAAAQAAELQSVMCFSGGAGRARDTTEVHAAAARGLQGAARPLPFLAQIQKAFGPAHDLSGVRAHQGPETAAACQDVGASAFAARGEVAFGATPSLEVAAHEAAHVVQQRQGIRLPGGVSRPGDPSERQADAVADRVVAGRSAADLLGDAGSDGSLAAAPVQGEGGVDSEAPPLELGYPQEVFRALQTLYDFDEPSKDASEQLDRIVRVAGLNMPAEIDFFDAGAEILAQLKAGLLRQYPKNVVARNKQPPAQVGDAGVRLGYQDLSREERTWLYAFSQLGGLESLLSVKQPLADKQAPVESSRVATVAAALSMVGQVEAMTPSGQREENIPTRRGWRQLLDFYTAVGVDGGMFKDQFPKNVMDVRIKIGPDGGQRAPSWCGVFALWALQRGGIASNGWASADWRGHQGPGSDQWNAVPADEEPRPGDLAIHADGNHHALVVSANGKSITTVEGNLGAQSMIAVRTLDRSFWDTGIFRALPKPKKP